MGQATYQQVSGNLEASMKNVAEQLREKRESLGLSRERAVEYFRREGYDFSPKSLQNWETGVRSPRNVDLKELLVLLETYSDLAEKDDTGKRQVTHYGPASAGDGRTLQPTGEVELTEGEYRARFGARSTDRVGLFKIEGDSAAPIYFDGEQIPVEMKGETQDFREDTVYVFRYRNDIMVKRLRTLQDGCVRAESLNPGIDDRVLHPDGDNFEIVGRVIDNAKQQLYTSMVGRFMRQKGQDAA